MKNPYSSSENFTIYAEIEFLEFQLNQQLLLWEERSPLERMIDDAVKYYPDIERAKALRNTAEAIKRRKKKLNWDTRREGKIIYMLTKYINKNGTTPQK